MSKWIRTLLVLCGVGIGFRVVVLEGLVEHPSRHFLTVEYASGLVAMLILSLIALWPLASEARLRSELWFVLGSGFAVLLHFLLDDLAVEMGSLPDDARRIMPSKVIDSTNDIQTILFHAVITVAGLRTVLKTAQVVKSRIGPHRSPHPDSGAES